MALRRAAKLCPQSDSDFVGPDLTWQCSMCELWLFFQGRSIHRVLDHATMLPELQQTLCFHFTAVLFKADFGLPFWKFFAQKKVSVPFYCEFIKFAFWLFSPSASHSLRPKIRCTTFHKIFFAKSGEFLKSLTMCLRSVPCSGVGAYICSPQTDSCILVAGTPQLLKFPNTSQDAVIP